MKLTPIQKGKSKLRPRARLIKTIGEELISNDIVAIIELVKNSYDANASIITINFQGIVKEVKEGKKKKKVLIRQGGSILISDDGIGMSLGKVKTAWMEPATINKKNTKRSANGKRRHTGEKGIGRFASAKLATSLKMITRSINDNEIVVDFNWSDFSDDKKYLDQVKCSWAVRKPVEIKHSGTTLKLLELNSDWDEEKFRELRIALSRLINPVSPITDFLMDIQVPQELNDYSGLVNAPESLNKPDYYIKGSIDKNGIPDIKYFSKKVGKEESIIARESDFSLREPIRKSVVDAFTFEFRAWDREDKSLQKIASETGSTVKNIKRDLDELGGISIYRDDFRVLPYGEQKNDWLRLDLRRVNNPTMRLSNNQIVGYVLVSLDKNPDLKDQSNREGIVESQAFTDLKEIIKNILNQVEQKRYEERPRESDEAKSQQGLFSNFSIAPVAQLVQTKLPNDKEVNELFAKTEIAIQQGVKKIQEVLSRYRRLSTLGLLIDVILHDGNNFLANIDSEIHLLLKELDKKDSEITTVKEHIKNINEGRRVIAQLFKRIEPFGGRKRGRPKDIVIEEAIADIFALYKNELTKLNINCFLPTSKNEVRIDEAELQMIFVNLLLNSIYWLETITSERKIEILVENTSDELSVIFSDSGPGVKEEHQQIIFDPYFTTRPDGVGLGLTIVGELVTEYNGDFTLVNNGPLDGASFKITFKRRI
jgi:signal transduction histidine kinase